MDIDWESVSGVLQGAMQSIADGVGVSVEFLWPILVKQSYVVGTMGLMWVMLAIILAIILVKNTSKWWTRLDKCYGDSGGFGMAGICILYILMVVSLLVGGHHAATRLINPEYYALKSVFNMAEQLVPGSGE